MAELKGLMLSLSQIHTSPRELMVAANRIIADNLDARSFITMTYAVLDMGTAHDDLRARRPHAAHPSDGPWPGPAGADPDPRRHGPRA